MTDMGPPSTPMVDIERLDPGAWERAQAVRIRALRDAPDAFWVTVEQEAATTPTEWRQRLERSDAATFVASDHRGDVGLAVGGRHQADDNDAGLYAMWVAPRARGRGVAQALIGEVIRWARAEGYRSLRLHVADTNAAGIALYERLGFKPTGGTCAFPHPREHITEHERMFKL